jgi:lipoyl(octanoyl) transferase
LRVSKWIAYHGCAININNNLKQYLKIIPCGLDNKKITSVLKETNNLVKTSNKKLIDIFIKNIKKI